MTKRTLTVERGGAPDAVPVPDRGRLIGAREIIRRHFADLDEPPSEDWVRETVPHKVKLSHRKVCWYEADVAAWVASRREEAA